ncbi:MAG: hypothetical protein KDC95_16140 [Planctomycetes bacterium]|nr:hypothetical protein [Planctomycetota bacterium]
MTNRSRVALLMALVLVTGGIMLWMSTSRVGPTTTRMDVPLEADREELPDLVVDPPVKRSGDPAVASTKTIEVNTLVTKVQFDLTK